MLQPETPSATTLILDVPDWPGHLAGQHVDVRLTAEDGYQAERSYSIASAPQDPHLAITIERIDDGEVSPYLTDELRPGDQLELRGPIGGYFTWEAADGGPLLLARRRLRARPAHGDAAPPRRGDERRGGDAAGVGAIVGGRAVPRRARSTRRPRGHRPLHADSRAAAGMGQAGPGASNAEMLRGLGADRRGAAARVRLRSDRLRRARRRPARAARASDPHAIKTERFGPTGGS